MCNSAPQLHIPNREVEEDSDNVHDPVTAKELMKVLKGSRNRSAPGPDGINYKTLKIFNITHPNILCTVYDACFRFRVFPGKPGLVIWLPKSGKDPLSAEAYRPITLLSTLGKTLEKLTATAARMLEQDTLTSSVWLCDWKGNRGCYPASAVRNRES